MSKTYTPEQVAELSQFVLDGMHEGLSLRQSCRETGLAMATFLGWCSADERLADRYAAAREALIGKIADEITEIADEDVPLTAAGTLDSAAVQKQRLRVDTRKWLLSKIAPRQYGEKVETTVVGADGGPVQTSMTVEFVKAK